MDGGGGNRTPVRKCSTAATTCLSHRFISPSNCPVSTATRGLTSVLFRTKAPRCHPIRSHLNDEVERPVGEFPQLRTAQLIKQRKRKCFHLLFCSLFYESATNSACDYKLHYPRRSQVTPMSKNELTI